MAGEIHSFVHKGSAIRLDHLLRENLGVGLRRAQRLVARGNVYVDGRVGIRKGDSIYPGQQVEVCLGRFQAPRKYRLEILRQGALWAAVYKPAGMHSEQGESPESAAAELPGIFTENDPRLLNRLDKPTTGILLVGLSRRADSLYSRAQKAGEVKKTYLAFVHGKMEEEIVVRRYIDHSRRKKVKVLDREEKDDLRLTRVYPLEYKDGVTLVRAVIQKGKRHQVRAHLSSAGYPILGDGLYACGRYENRGKTLYLHHEKIEWPDFWAFCPAPFS